MKKLIYIVAIFNAIGAMNTKNCVAQRDTVNVELITFESSSPFFRQGTPTTTSWQIGQPSKTTFTEAHSAPNAIVTDTLNSYPTNNHSWFDLVLPLFEFGYPYVGVEFMQRLNTTASRDGGYITVSYNQGESWVNIIQDTATYWPWYNTPTDQWNNINLYSNNDKLFNGEFGFSGTISDWEKVQFSWYHMLEKKGYWADTMLVRFNFISDSIPETLDGWMIDNIRLFWVDLGGDIHETSVLSNLEAYPNPLNEEAVIRTRNQELIQVIEVYSPEGKLIKHQKVQSDEFVFKKGELKEGIYLINCLFKNSSSETIRVIIN